MEFHYPERSPFVSQPSDHIKYCIMPSRQLSVYLAHSVNLLKSQQSCLTPAKTFTTHRLCLNCDNHHLSQIYNRQHQSNSDSRKDIVFSLPKHFAILGDGDLRQQESVISTVSGQYSRIFRNRTPSRSYNSRILQENNVNYIRSYHPNSRCLLSHESNHSFIARSQQRHFASATSNESVTSYHTRPLPDHLVALSSRKGKQLFREALAMNGLESYFPLSEQFITQSEPSFCSISSLAMTLNALKYDPKKIWKSPWRWVTEETLLCESSKICGHNIENIKQNGLNFSQFELLGHCHGISIKSFQVRKLLNPSSHHINDANGQWKGSHPVDHNASHKLASHIRSHQVSSHGPYESQHGHQHSPQHHTACDHDHEHTHAHEENALICGISHHVNYAYNIESFRSLVESISSSKLADTFIIVNFSRKVLGQTGDGHFSPIGGYHKEKDLVLILDVARFKYPPYWVKLSELWEAMAAIDKQTNKARGYFILSSSKVETNVSESYFFEPQGSPHLKQERQSHE